MFTSSTHCIVATTWANDILAVSPPPNSSWILTRSFQGDGQPLNNLIKSLFYTFKTQSNRLHPWPIVWAVKTRTFAESYGTGKTGGTGYCQLHCCCINLEKINFSIDWYQLVCARNQPEIRFSTGWTEYISVEVSFNVRHFIYLVVGFL